ncbi:hypothetical protein LJR009_001595 [Bosea sp. LjRoot9]|uniref:hypothetical protein n=1 Tax=Bosea sp. LjRoot9 TaxID=3342341 RepID=UPI003ECF8A34
MSTFGGVIKMRLSNGTNLAVRGSVTHNPDDSTDEKVVNTNGSVDITKKLEGYEAGMSLANRDENGAPINVPALKALGPADITFLHDSERVDRTYSKASIIGRASVDDMTGEITGLTIVSEGYLETQR